MNKELAQEEFSKGIEKLEPINRLQLPPIIPKKKSTYADAKDTKTPKIRRK